MNHNLAIEMVGDNKTLAVGMYLGCGYTAPALRILGIIANEANSYEYNTIDDPVKRAIYLLEMTGAGIHEKEEVYAEKHGYDVAEYIEEGAIFLSEVGMGYAMHMSEIKVRVSLDEQNARFAVYKYSPPGLRNEADLPELSKEEGRVFYGSLPFCDVGEVIKIVESNTVGVRLHDGGELRWIA